MTYQDQTMNAHGIPHPSPRRAHSPKFFHAKYLKYQFVSEYSLCNVWSSQYNGLTVPDTRFLDGKASVAIVRVLGTTSCLLCAERRRRRPAHVDVDSQYDCMYYWGYRGGSPTAVQA